MHEIEDGFDLRMDWRKLEKVVANCKGLVPVCVQDIESGEVLILAYANELALQTALERRLCVLWSSSRGALWIKGDTSGDYLELKNVFVNCEQNSLLYLVKPVRSGACHTRDEFGRTRKSCYYRQVSFDDGHTLAQSRARIFPHPSTNIRNYILLSSGFLLGVTCTVLATKQRRN
mmetsp:Transcript_13880/g.18529  ORF Transcript_13880/g.18529 Transcript_13880/m.18529 type:complete len:175 (+) Transcript_13880:53-577(+)